MNLDGDSLDVTTDEITASEDHLSSLLDDHAPTDELGKLVARARAAAEPTELRGRDDAVRMLLEGGRPAVVPLARRQPWGKRLVAAKAAAVVAAVCTAGVAAAAATGVIDLEPGAGPEVVTTSDRQDAEPVANDADPTSTTGAPSTTSSIPASPTSAAAPDSTAPPSGAAGPSLDGPAKFGLCTAFGARDSMPGSSVAAANLAAAAAEAGQSVAEFCEGAVPGGAPEDDPIGGSRGNGNGAGNGKGTGNGAANGNGNGAANGNSTAPAGSNGAAHGGSSSSSAGGTPNANANPVAGGSANAKKPTTTSTTQVPLPG